MQNPEKRLKRGDAIPGSRFYREYCARCDEPMRVTAATLARNMAVYCEACDPPALQNRAATTEDISPWQSNAIRHLEES